MKDRNVPHSVAVRLLQRARAQAEDYEYLLLRYVMPILSRPADDALVRAVISFSSGLEMVIERHDEEQCIQCKITWIHKGDQTHRSIRKYLPDRLREFQASCERSGWRVLSPLIVDSGSDHASGCLIAGAKDVNSKMAEMARTIGEGLSRLQL